MGFLSFLGLGKEAGDAIASPVEAIGNVLDKLFTSDEEREAVGIQKEQLDLIRQEIMQKPQIAQTEINKLEAQHRSIFVAGWRPYIGWVLGTSLGIYYIPQFIMATILWTKMCWTAQEFLNYPIENISGLTELVVAMLGVAGFRTVEKLAGKAK